MRSGPSYSPVPLQDKAAVDGLHNESGRSSIDLSPRWSIRRVPLTLIIATAIVGWIFSCLVAFKLGLSWPRDLNSLCIDHANLPSPISQEIGLTYHDINFDSKLTRGNIYRENASQRVDDAWNELGIQFNPMKVPESLGVKSGIPPGNVKFPAETGGGYLAMVEVFHQLHCLNLLRKSAWFNYGYYRDLGENEFSNSPDIVEIHVGHCLDFLRQQLMCTADIGLVSFVWVENQPGPVADFSTKHKCKDFEAIKNWAELNQLDTVPEDNRPTRRPGDRLEEHP